MNLLINADFHVKVAVLPRVPSRQFTALDGTRSVSSFPYIFPITGYWPNWIRHLTTDQETAELLREQYRSSPFIRELMNKQPPPPSPPSPEDAGPELQFRFDEPPLLPRSAPPSLPPPAAMAGTSPPTPFAVSSGAPLPPPPPAPAPVSPPLRPGPPPATAPPPPPLPPQPLPTPEGPRLEDHRPSVRGPRDDDPVSVRHINAKATDVYSWGIVLNECWTGNVPYGDEASRSPRLVFDIIDRGARPSIPPGTPPALRALMCQCWAENPAQRPTFPQIVDRMRAICGAMGVVLPNGTA
ncbi:hypothetical protein PAPYR_6457 [Paratrimastix pyriformis]|uniref:Serine-threonine/tyrosine-protein kinase catalytic domain-containing protein n=1 Tax=Paratrimastix pyriformis TaxID=342808 RepID=A0ABQ8UF69_9EUKA|nr:hypothetical protein PAPYR_6457 [Paratrimastix pyriformis]